MLINETAGVWPARESKEKLRRIPVELFLFLMKNDDRLDCSSMKRKGQEIRIRKGRML